MVEVLLRRAETKLAEMEANAALAEVEEALQLAPGHGRAHQLKGRILFLQVEYRKSIQSFQRTLELIGPNPETLYLLGEAYLQMKEYDDAERTFQDLLELAPGYRDAAERLAILYVSTNSRDKELPALERAAAGAPDSAEIRLLLGLTLRQRGESERSLEVLQRAAKLAPDNPRAHYEVGMTLKHMGRGDEARAAFERAVDLDPLHEGACNALMLYARKDSPEVQERARQRFETAREFGRKKQALRNEIEYDPGNPAAIYQLALLQAQHGHIEESETIFERVLMMDPKHRPAATNLGRALMQLERHEQAIPPFQRAVDLEPDIIEWRVDLARAMVQASHPGRTDAVAEVAKRVGDEPNQLFQLGQLQSRLGDLVAAEATFSGILERAPGAGEVWASRGQLRGTMGRTAEAVADLNKALELGTSRDAALREMLRELASP